MNKELFTERFNALIKKYNCTKKDLADYLEVTPSLITRYTTDTIPNIQNIRKIAIYFNTTTDYLLGISNNETNESLQEIINAINSLNLITNQNISQEITIKDFNCLFNCLIDSINKNTQTLEKIYDILSNNQLQQTIQPPNNQKTKIITVTKTIIDDFGDSIQVKEEVEVPIDYQENDIEKNNIDNTHTPPADNVWEESKKPTPKLTDIAKKGSEIKKNTTIKEVNWNSDELKVNKKQALNKVPEETINYDFTPLVYAKTNNSADLFEEQIDIKAQDILIQHDDKFAISSSEFVKECMNSNSCVLYIENDLLNETHIEVLTNYFKNNFKITYFTIEDNKVIINN